MSEKEKDCPDWALQVIEQLRQIEVYLGHVPKGSDWGVELLEKVSKRTFSPEEEVFDEDKAHMVFQRICLGLQKEGWVKEEIASAINQRIGYSGGPKYCDENEVEEALLSS